MKKKEILEKLTVIFRTSFNDSELVLNDEMSAKDVDDWDSLTHMLMISEVESQFGIRFKLKELNQLKTVGDMATILEDKLK
jgi:acyl carrier protein